VIKKFGDDRGGNLAALVAYYGFFSIFPLLLVLVSVLGFALAGDRQLQRDVLDSSLASFPVIGDQIRRNIGSLDGSAVAIVVGLATALWAGLGVVRSLQEAMDRIWGVTQEERQSFVVRNVRALGFVTLLGAGVLLSTIIAGAVSELGIGLVAQVATLVLPFALSFGVALVTFRSLTAAPVSLGDVVIGAGVAALAWTVLQSIGGMIVRNQIQSASSTYGTFALVIGLLVWMLLIARITLYAAELNVVRTRRLWPRDL
jgi:inner membrane protein YhjD